MVLIRRGDTFDRCAACRRVTDAGKPTRCWKCPGALRERRNALADWLYREHAGAPYTITQIVDVSGIYDDCVNGRYDTCRRDLLRLYSNGVLTVYPARPARWEHANV